MSRLFDGLDAFYLEHWRCGTLDTGIEDGRVWMTCECDAGFSCSLARSARLPPSPEGGLPNGPDLLAARPASPRARFADRLLEAPVIDRRTFLVCTGTVLLAAPLGADAQQAGRIPRVGVLWHAGSADEEGAYYTGLLEGFRDVGYVDGRNIILEHRFPNEMPEQFRSMTAELVARDTVDPRGPTY